MRKLIFILALLIATPAFAALTIVCDVNDEDCNYVDIKYSGADPCERPRAFALVVTTTNGARIADIINYKTDGESNSVSRGYGIYPSGIDVNEAGDVNSWGDPKADPCDPGGSIDPCTTRIILEFGSLYYGDSNAPVVWGVTSGLLCTVQLDANGAESTTVTVTDEAQYRGGVITEDGNTVSIDSNVVNDCWKVVAQDPNCLWVGKVFDSNFGPITQDMFDMWRDTNNVNYELCWCCPAQKYANGVYSGASGNRVDTQDLGGMKQSWYKRWYQTGYLPCIDFNLSGRVDTQDLGIMKQNWYTRPGDCTAYGY